MKRKNAWVISRGALALMAGLTLSTACGGGASDEEAVRNLMIGQHLEDLSPWLTDAVYVRIFHPSGWEVNDFSWQGATPGTWCRSYFTWTVYEITPSRESYGPSEMPDFARTKVRAQINPCSGGKIGDTSLLHAVKVETVEGGGKKITWSNEEEYDEKPVEEWDENWSTKCTDDWSVRDGCNIESSFPSYELPAPNNDCCDSSSTQS